MSQPPTEGELVAEIQRLRAESDKIKRDQRLMLAANERGIPLDLLATIDRAGEPEENILAALDNLRGMIDRAVQVGVEDRFRQGGRTPHVTREVGSKPLDKMTPAEINRDWPKIQERLKRGGR